MIRRVLMFISISFALISIPSANASTDVPVLTWEKGLEHNLVLGGNGDVKAWKMDLISTRGKALPFRMSKIDARGFVYFSLQVPTNLKSGIYSVVSTGYGKQQKVLAGVRIIDQSTFNLVQIPMKLLTLLLSLILLITSLSILRMPKYEKIEYIRSKPEEPSKKLIQYFYKLRVYLIDDIRNSLFKFKIIREGELLLKISPSLWALLPWFAVLLGSFLASRGNIVDGVSATSAFTYFGFAVLGVLDPFSGLMSGIGFSTASILLGHASHVRSIVSLISLSIGWFAPGILASLYSDALRKDRYSATLKKFLPELIGSAIGGLIFFVAQIMTNSFADRYGPLPSTGYLLPVVLIGLTFIRIKGEIFLNRNLHQTGENYQIRVLHMPRVISPNSVLFVGLYFTTATYLWTESIAFSISSGFLITFPLALLIVRFENPVFTIFRKFDRHIAMETLIICALAFGAFVNIQDFPLDVTQKSKLFILSSGVILVLHGFYSSFFDTSAREPKKVNFV